MKTTIDRSGRMVIPKEILRQSGIKPGMPLEVRWENGTIAVTPASSAIKLERKRRLLLAVAAKKVPRLPPKAANSTRNAQRQGFRKLVDRARREGGKKWFTKLEDLPK